MHSKGTPSTKSPLQSRTLSFRKSAIGEMARLADESGALDLSQGLPDFDPPGEVLEAAVEAIRGGDNQYTIPSGTLEFRRAIAGKYARHNDLDVDPEAEVTVMCGVSEAMLATILALTQPDDEAIILEPWYENYVPGCLMAGVKPRFVPLREPDYVFDPDELRAAFNDRTRLILVNTPHNPTGRVFTRDELTVIADLCQAFDTMAVTDEIYEHILYKGHQHVSLASLDGMEERTVTIGGLSKTYSVTGWRIGWAVAAAPLSRLIRKVHDYITVCAPAPPQAAGIAALALPDSYYAEMCAQFEARGEILLGALRKSGLGYTEPEGAYYVMMDFRDVDWDQAAYSEPGWTRDRAFAEYMAREVGVAGVPGSSFYSDRSQGTSRIRLNFAKSEEKLREAATRLTRIGR